MPNVPIDPLTGPKYVLEGRIVTMGPQGVVPRGAVYIDAGEIKAVQGARKAPPPGFDDAPRVRTGDTIYPGLIELHNHLCYNAMPLWDVPRKYTNNGQWKTHEDYQRRITKPSQVLGRSPGVVEALVRFVECKCLLGGVTTSQGITLATAPGIQVFYDGIVRNVERTRDPSLPEAGTKIANPSGGEAPKYLERLQKETCYLQHISEGTDDTARGWFLRLRLENGQWALNHAFSGIHSTALTFEDFQIIQEVGGSMVWSPLSNFLLYGRTADIESAKKAGVLMGIGSDWAPSGSKNLLGELKVAWLASRHWAGEDEAPILSPQELVAMATTNAARILKWDKVLGTIEPGKRADLIAVNGQSGDDYLRLIEARETAITLVVINGVPRAGQPRLMTLFGTGTETIRVGRSRRVLNLAQTTTHPLVGDLTLTAATERLENAMRRLPALAAELDDAALDGWLGGSLDTQGTRWRVFMDIEEEGLDETALAARPLSDYVQPMSLEPITVADDQNFLAKLAAARNLPEFIKEGLPPLYGVSLPPPESTDFLRENPEAVAEELLSTTIDLKTFLRTWGELTLDERCTIVDQALLVIGENYVHLPMKRAMHAVEPVQRLRLLKHRLEEMDESDLGPEIDFHNEMAQIFNSLRDLHTAYRLPDPFKQKTAWLPYLIETCWEHDHRKYIVSRVVGNAGPDTFQPGVEVLHWCGVPIHQAVTRHAARLAGSNPAARHARGLDAMTIRPLAHGLPPDEEWVTLRYRGLDGRIHEWSQEWLVFEPGQSAVALNPESLTVDALALGLDAHTDHVREVKKILYAGKARFEEQRVLHMNRPQMVRGADDDLPTYMPTVFRAKPVITSHGTYGYVRIFSFNVASPDAFFDEFARLLQALPRSGLIIDVRGNPGGHIHAAERILQLLTPHPVEPQRAQFINSPMNRLICRRHAPSTLFPELDLHPWLSSIEQAVETGAVYSLGYPITPPQVCNDIGQTYHGPVLLIVDALCYSATDMFAAGFKDHQIGPILGTTENTGAGGANVWSYRLLCELADGIGLPGRTAYETYRALPKGCDLRVAMRRTLRVGPNAGIPVEDLGIEPDAVHRMTITDLLQGNRDLIEKAAAILHAQKRHHLEVSVVPRTGRYPQLQVASQHVTRLDVFIDDRPQRSLDVDDQDHTVIDLEPIKAGEYHGLLRLTLQAFDGSALVAAYRGEIMPG